MSTAECAFCRKLADLKALPADELVAELPHAIVLLGPWQYYHGYCIVVARRHATELSQLSDAERHGYFDDMCRVAKAIEMRFQPCKLNYELLGNQEPHLHWHLFPRYREDPERLQPVWHTLEQADHTAGRLLCSCGPIERLETAGALRESLKTVS